MKWAASLLSLVAPLLKLDYSTKHADVITEHMVIGNTAPSFKCIFSIKLVLYVAIVWHSSKIPQVYYTIP